MLYAVQLPVVYSGSTAPSPRAGAENVLADGKCPEAETCAVRRLNASDRGFLPPAYSIIAVNNIAILPFGYSLSLSLFYLYSILHLFYLLSSARQLGYEDTSYYLMLGPVLSLSWSAAPPGYFWAFPPFALPPLKVPGFPLFPLFSHSLSHTLLPESILHCSSSWLFLLGTRQVLCLFSGSYIFDCPLSPLTGI